MEGENRQPEVEEADHVLEGTRSLSPRGARPAQPGPARGIRSGRSGAGGPPRPEAGDQLGPFQGLRTRWLSPDEPSSQTRGVEGAGCAPPEGGPDPRGRGGGWARGVWGSRAGPQAGRGGTEGGEGARSL